MKKLENFTKQSFSLELIAQNGSEEKLSLHRTQTVNKA
jgi:hypothetical protein